MSVGGDIIRTAEPIRFYDGASNSKYIAEHHCTHCILRGHISRCGGKDAPRPAAMFFQSTTCFCHRSRGVRRINRVAGLNQFINRFRHEPKTGRSYG